MLCLNYVIESLNHKDDKYSFIREAMYVPETLPRLTFTSPRLSTAQGWKDDLSTVVRVKAG